MLEILRWMATQIPGRARARVHLGVGRPLLLGLSELQSRPTAWAARPDFERLISEGQKLGFKMMPMFGTNSANRKQPVWPKIADGDDAQDRRRRLRPELGGLEQRPPPGRLAHYMNLGADSWRNHLDGTHRRR